MNCEQMVELMERYVDHDLTTTEQDSLMAHISTCPDCAASFEQLQRLSAELSILPMVSPPFSIVDSILPKLAELDAQNAAVRVAYAPVTPMVAKRTKQFWSSSWKLATGFVAAAVFISILAVNLPSGSKKDASEMLKNAQVTASSATAMADEGKGLEGNTEESVAAPMAKAEAPAATAQPELATDQQAADQPISSGNPEPNSDRKTFDKVIATGTAAPESPGFTVKGTPADNPAPQSPKPEPGDSLKGAMLTPTAPGDHAMASTDGKYTGRIMKNSVQILAADGSLIFSSGNHWGEKDVIHFVVWENDRYFIYDITSDAGNVRRYIIDAIELKEQEQIMN